MNRAAPERWAPWVYPILEADHRLARRCAPIIPGAGAHILSRKLIRTLRATPNAAGLAAPQIGYQVSMVATVEDGEVVVALNPTITRSEGEQTQLESCLSLPGLWWPIARPKRIWTTYTTPEGDKVRAEHRGFMARCYSHEIDHLRGRLLLDLIPDEEISDLLATPAGEKYADFIQAWRSSRIFPAEY